MVIRDPLFWKKSLEEAPAKSKAQVCEQILDIWPHSSQTWRVYLEHTSSPEEKGQLLKRALNGCIDLELFEAYIKHIRETDADQLAAAYEYALATISSDPQSGLLWKQYIDWLSVQPVSNDWEEQFRRDRVRKAFKRAITLPLVNIENLWRQYSNFENKISRASARKFIDERSAGYMKARSALKSWQTLTKSISFDTMPSPEVSVATTPIWKSLIEWERSNPLELEPEESEKRVEFMARKASQCARWSAELWFEGGLLCGHTFWEQGCKAMPENMLLAFKCVEYYELEDRFDELRQVLLNLAGTALGSKDKIHLEGAHNEIDNEDNMQDQSLQGETSTETTQQQSIPQKTEVSSEQVRIASAAWSELVRVTHRVKGIDEARVCICEALDAISEPSSSLYVAASQLESADIDRARSILSLAFQKFGQTDIEFVLIYLQWLFAHKDVINARAVFEQCANTKSRRLWDEMLQHEATYARSSNVSIKVLKTLETRYSAIFDDVDQVQLFSRRYGNLLAVSPQTINEITPEIITESAAIQQFIAMLPPASVYDGPEINIHLLMEMVLKA